MHETRLSRDTSRPEPQRDRPLRVCMVAYAFYERDSRVMRYAESLTQRGDVVDVFALQKVGTPRTETFSGVRVQRLQGRVKDEKSRFTYLWRILCFLTRAMWQISIHDFKQKYDIVHVHSVPDFLVFSALLPWLRGTPIILDIHDILPEFYASKFSISEKSTLFRALCAMERLSAAFASHVIVSNHAWQGRLLSRSVNPDRCSVVLNVPDRSIFKPMKKTKSSGNRFVLIYHGTLNWHQGLDLAVRAFAKIKDIVPEADFHIYGDGPSKADLLVLIEKFHLENRIVLFEPKPLREIPAVIEAASLGIVPKRKDTFGNEAFSTKILEFMAMGVPVIVSDTDVDRYYFNDSVVRFFRGNDENDLARNILDLILHSESRLSLIERATELVAQNDWALNKQDYFDLLDSLL